jgi:DNA-binding protein
MSESNIVYIGRKPVMAYCMAVMSAMRSANSEAILMARGRAISTAVDVAEVVRNQYMSNLIIKDISIGTEQFPNIEGGTRNVSTIKIILTKSDPVEDEKNKVIEEITKPLETTGKSEILGTKNEVASEEAPVQLKEKETTSPKKEDKVLEGDKRIDRGIVE